MKKRLISTLLAIAMLASLLPTAFAADTVTRAEWISQLVAAFSMTVEDDTTMPDNYFSDITESDGYYRDILLAVEFGVIDLEAGEAFKPTDPATREFAARTLNSCLQFQLDEDAEYTYSEADTVTYPDDIQIAVNRNWFALSSGNFLPEQAITSAEVTAMLADAKAVIDSEAIDANYDSKFEFADGVIVVPETAQTTIDENNTVTITDNETEINAGDVFVVFSSGIPIALKAISVEIVDNTTTITSTKEGSEGAITDADSEGVMEVDVEDFQPEEISTYTITNTETMQQEEMTIELYSVERSKSDNLIKINKKIKIGNSAVGALTAVVKKPKIEHKAKIFEDVYNLKLTADTSVTTSIEFDLGNYAGIPSTLILGSIPIGGVGSVSLSMEYDIKGGLSYSSEGQIEAGFNYDRGNLRWITNYTKKSFSFNAQARIQAGIRLAARVDLIAIKGEVYAEAGARISFDAIGYSDGEPKSCITLQGYLYAEAGASISIPPINKEFPFKKEFYNASNSPVRVVEHYEDGKLVSSCSRGQSLKYTTSAFSNYFSPLPGYGQGSYGGGEGVEPVVIWEYTTDADGNATITKYNGNASALAIPSELDGHKVVKIGASVFKDKKSLRSVTIPNSVTYIDNNAFAYCTNLSSVTLSKNLETLGYYAFKGCSSLTEIEIPKSLKTTTDAWSSGSGYLYGPFNSSGLKSVTFEEGATKVAEHLFHGANNLENVNLLDTIISINTSAFNGYTALNNITVPNSVTSIGSSAFSGCTKLNNVTIPNSVTLIDNNAFNGCTNLSNIVLSKSLETLGYYAFKGCSSLTEIEIPKSLKTITDAWNSGSGYLYGPFNSSGLKSVTFEEGATKVAEHLFHGANNLENVNLLDTIISINTSAFNGCTALNNITVPNSVTSIGSSAFSSCTKLNNVTIPNSVTLIDNNAFNGCTNLSNIVLSKSLETLGYYAFKGCSSLTEIEIPKSLKTTTNAWSSGSGYLYGSFNSSGLKSVTFEEGATKVAEHLLYGANHLENVTLLDTITSIDTSAFNSCTSLKEISIPDSVTDMGTYIFAGCTNLEKVKLPTTRQNITEGTFRDCKNLKDIKLPNTVTAIRKNAFQGCSSLENIKLPESVNIIEDAAFENCTKLKSINIPNNMTSIGSWVFKNCDALTDFKANINGSIGKQAFYDCDKLTSVTIGDGVTSIGSELCYGCDNLSEVKLGKYITTIPDSAFRLCQNLTTITLPRFCKTVASNAFAEDTKLTSAYVPVTVSSIENNSFSYPAKMTMYGKSGSYAEEYANSRNMTFSAVSVPITSMSYADNAVEIGRRENIRPTLNIEPAFDTSTITFASSDEKICTVSETGEIYGKNYGTATVTATSDSDIKTEIAVTVVRLADSVSLDKTELELEAGDTAKLTATLNPSDATDKITWKSSNENVATVDNGTVTAVGAGTAVIAVTTTGGKTASCTVNVTGTFTVTATAGENGTISPSGDVSVRSDEKKIFNILPDYRYVVKDVLVNGASVGAVETYTFRNLTDNAAITAEFAKVNAAYENGTVTISSEAALKDLKLIIAIYDEDGRLTDCEIKTVTANVGESYQDTIVEAENVKLMLWSGLNTMRPIWSNK